jgi:predicted acylesterase/phospholipase RssA
VHPRELPPCDLVMKGGVSSGVVYPGAVLELATRYRFENVGGTSVGAVAASMAAAAEYARQRADRLEIRGVLEVAEEFKQPGFVLSLFQPAPSGRPLFELALGMMGAKGSYWHRTRVLAVAALRHRPLHALVATLGAAGVLALLSAALGHLSIVPTIVLVLLGGIGLLLLAGWAILAPLGSMLRGAYRALPGQGFGVCPGTRQDPHGPDALSEWLHAMVQRCAELPLDRPLTFAMLEQERIGLQMVGTDLRLARPVTIPFSAEQYLFAPAELRALFPASVVDHVLAAAGVPNGERDSSRTWFMPAKELPVVIGARVSASFPILLSSLKLYSARAEAGRPIESFLSDGGVTSNFPIHFFDDWLPGHPTFGLDLVPAPDGPSSGPLVYMPHEADGPRMPRGTDVRTLSGFLRQIEDSARNWRDELQAELPGFRDRVCQISIRPGEGGFNVNADPATVAGLLERGRAAGREILSTFDWDQHRLIRFVNLIELLEDNFALLAQRFEVYREWLDSGESEGALARAGYDMDWLRKAEAATAQMVANVPRLPASGTAERAQPEPAMRIGPRV